MICERCGLLVPSSARVALCATHYRERDAERQRAYQRNKATRVNGDVEILLTKMLRRDWQRVSARARPGKRTYRKVTMERINHNQQQSTTVTETISRAKGLASRRRTRPANDAPEEVIDMASCPLCGAQKANWDYLGSKPSELGGSYHRVMSFYKQASGMLECIECGSDEGRRVAWRSQVTGKLENPPWVKEG